MFDRLIRKLTQAPEATRATNLQEWADTIPETIRIKDIAPRCGCRAVGVIQKIRIDPRAGTGSVEVTLDDGTGRLRAKWLGRSKLNGIALGKGLEVEATAGDHAGGELVVLNPSYRLMPGPDGG
ncbi:MAG: OB-fold nucleic acid binding domain-containing protein [Actinobacteria bacterium]|nr:OB-fold nucleic acid binding domain-containing protein [Actinomycetota bacterium]